MHMTITDDFSALGLSEQMLTAVRAKGFETPTAIQKLTIPHLLKDGDDAADGERAGIAHEDLCREAVVPEEADQRTGQRRCEDDQFAAARNVHDVQVVG